jgi:hypothetical protein
LALNIFDHLQNGVVGIPVVLGASVLLVMQFAQSPHVLHVLDTFTGCQMSEALFVVYCQMH